MISIPPVRPLRRIRAPSHRRLVEPKRFVADHPFFVAIRDDRTGAILFAGQPMNPGA